MLPNITYSGILTDNDWDRNQVRTLDPYSLLKSDTLNQINTIFGNNTILTGMELQTHRDEQDTLLTLDIKPGYCIKDKVLIQFKSDTTIYIKLNDPVFKEAVKDSSIMIVVNYKYEKVVPANIAKIEVIEENEYDPEIHLGLYRIFFDSNGNISDEGSFVRLITPKDNIIYEQILQEINSTATSAVYNILSELGDKGIGALLGTYMRVHGTSISGDYPDKNYYLVDTISKVSFNLNTGEGEVWRNSLHIITTFEAKKKYYQVDHLLKFNPDTYEQEHPEWIVYSQVLTTDTKVNSYKKYYDIVVYDDTENYYVYVWFKDTIYGTIEVFENEFNSDAVDIKSIIKTEPDTNSMNLILTVSDRNNPAVKSNKIKSNSYLNNYIVWNESNQGHGSGMDSDMLDGWHKQDFVNEIEKVRQELIEAEERLNNRIDELRQYVDDTFIPLAQKDQPSGVAVLTNTDRSYEHDGEEIIDESEIGRVVPQTELYVCRMFGDKDQPHSVEFTHTNVNPTGTRRINCEGHFHATKVYNPAYKDIAEVFEANQDCNMVNCVRKIMALDPSSGLIRRCKPTDYAIVGICSDTYGYLLGASEDDIIQTGHLLPIGLAGTVWVDIENNLEPDVNYLGCLIGVGANGKGRIMSRTDKRYCVGMVVEANPDKYSNRVKILIGNRWIS